MMPLSGIKGLSPELAQTFKTHGIDSIEELLAAGKTTTQRRQLGELIGADPKMILELVNRADLARVKGIGGVYADLLESAGVDTIKELATRVPANLLTKIEETNQKTRLTSHPPSLSMVEEWVSQAKALPKMIEY